MIYAIMFMIGVPAMALLAGLAMALAMGLSKLGAWIIARGITVRQREYGRIDARRAGGPFSMIPPSPIGTVAAPRIDRKELSEEIFMFLITAVAPIAVGITAGCIVGTEHGWKEGLSWGFGWCTAVWFAVMLSLAHTDAL